MSSRFRSSVLLISAASVAVGVLGFIGVQTALAGQPADQVPASAPTSTFPVNAHGQTYGSELDARTPSEAPDLISAWATNGKLGYVKKTDLHPASSFSNPQEALAWQAKQNELPASWTIAVWDVDGTTQIGVFPMTRGSAGTPRTGSAG